jgi:glycosyltransferase involved in cell wall biosynthesis
LRLIYKNLKDQKADVYYCRIRDFRHILAYWAARKVRARFVLGLASDIDVEGLTKRLKYLYLAEVRGLWWFFNAILSEFTYFWLLRRSDLVLVQHSGQKEKLLKKGIDATVFNNLIDLSGIPQNGKSTGEDFCFVGSIDKRKGFVDFYQLMTKSSSLGFKIIGSPRDRTGYLYYEKCKELSNAKLLGRLSHSETLRQMIDSKALISTSPMEGFPNIFLEAWACGVPVMSLYFDPGDIIVKENLGVVANGNVDILLTAMKGLKYSTDFAARSKSYVQNNHSLTDDKIREISDTFSKTVKMK